MIHYLDYCSKCTRKNHCCSNPDEEGFITVGIKSAEHIKKATGLEFAEFLNYTKLKPKTIAECKNDKLNSEGRLRFSMISNNSILRMRMKSNGKCIFLNKKNQCAIYECRPNICKMYPFWYKRNSKNKVKITLHNTESNCLLLKHHPMKWLSTKDLKIFTNLATTIEKETIHYRKNIQKFVRKNNLSKLK